MAAEHAAPASGPALGRLLGDAVAFRHETCRPGCFPLRVRASLAKAYRATEYRAACHVIPLGRQAPAIDRLLASQGAREAALITAHNPFSRRKPPGWNQRMQSKLAQLARRHATLPAVGAWRGWSEDHLLLFASHRRALCLARRFQQHAIVSIRVRQPARVLFTS